MKLLSMMNLVLVLLTEDQTLEFQMIHRKNKGYFEDRRPSANCNPYLVCSKILETCCDDIEELKLCKILFIFYLTNNSKC